MINRVLFILMLFMGSIHVSFLQAHADVIELTTGEKLEGTIISQDNNELTISSETFTIALDKKQIKSIHRDPIQIETIKETATKQELLKKSDQVQNLNDTHSLHQREGTPQYAYFISYFGSEEAFLKAFASFQKIAQENPANIENRYKLGLCYYYLEEYTRAITELKYVIVHTPNDLDALTHLAYAYYYTGNLSASITFAEQVLKIRPSNIKIRELLASTYSQTDQLNKAIEQYEILRTDDKDNENIQMILNDLYTQVGKETK